MVVGAEGLDRIRGQRGRGWDLGEGPAVRPPEPEGAVRLARHVVALLVDRAVVPATEPHEVRGTARAPRAMTFGSAPPGVSSPAPGAPLGRHPPGGADTRPFHPDEAVKRKVRGARLTRFEISASVRPPKYPASRPRTRRP